jgi:hypothetical protein
MAVVMPASLRRHKGNAMHLKLVVAAAERVTNPGETFVEVLVRLEGDDTALLRMTVFTAQKLRAALASVVGE